jgi:hypothetical protein
VIQEAGMVAVMARDIDTLERESFTDDELTALALAADPDLTLAADAVSVWDVLGSSCEVGGRCMLPEWYMPSALAGARPERRRWHRWAALSVIVSLLLIDALGLCITYGQLVAA